MGRGIAIRHAVRHAVRPNDLAAPRGGRSTKSANGEGYIGNLLPLALWYDIGFMGIRINLRVTSQIVFCLFFLLTLRTAAQDSSGASTQVRKLEEKWTAAYKDRKIDILSSLLSDEFVITVEDGNTYSKAGYITHSADPSVHVDVAELSDLRVRVHGNVAVVTGAYHEVGQSNHKPYEYHDRLTDVWMKVGNAWQVIASHYSVPLK